MVSYSTLNYDARSTTHQISNVSRRLVFNKRNAITSSCHAKLRVVVKTTIWQQGFKSKWLWSTF